MEKIRQLIGDDVALIRLDESLRFSSETSVQQAEQIESDILEKVEIIRTHPEPYPPDKYKLENPEEY